MSGRPAPDLLLQVIEEQRLLRGEVAALRGEVGALRVAVEALGAPVIGTPEVALVRAIHAHVGPRFFSSADLIEHARLPQASALADAIIAVLGAMNARRLGHLFKRIEGVDCCGVEIARIATDRDGAVWRVLGNENSRSRT